MIRTRLLWFTLGFGSSAAAITHFVFKDLWVDRQILATRLKQQFDVLDTRVSSLEQVLPNNSNPQFEPRPPTERKPQNFG